MFNFIFNIFNKTKIENDNKLEPIITEPIITEPDITVCIKKTNFIKKINKIKNKINPQHIIQSYNWYPLEKYMDNYSKEYMIELMITERLDIFKKYPVLNGFNDYPSDVFNINRYSVQFENKYPEYKFIPAIP